MLNWIFENEVYTELYHQYFAEFLSSVDIQAIIDNAYNLIKSYLEKDPTAFYAYEEFELGVETLRQFCNLRSESISMQLENGETTDNMSYADASAITLSDMGSMGGGMGGFGGDMPDKPDNRDAFDGTQSDNDQMPQDSDDSSAQSAELSGKTTNTPLSDDTIDNMPQDMPDGFTGNMPDGFDSANLPESFDPSDLPDGFSAGFPMQASGEQRETTPSDDSDSTGDTNTDRPSGGNMQMPGANFNFAMNETGTSSSDLSGWIWIAVSVIILAVGLAVARKYRS